MTNKGDVFPSPRAQVRALACHGDVLVGDNAGDLRAWDMNAVAVLRGALSRAYCVRAIDVDVLTHLVYTASDDRFVRFGARPNYEVCSEATEFFLCSPQARHGPCHDHPRCRWA